MSALSHQQKLILKFLADHAEKNYTRREISWFLSNPKNGYILHSSVCGRVNELLADSERAWLDELDARKCRISGKTANPVQIHRPVGRINLFLGAV